MMVLDEKSDSFGCAKSHETQEKEARTLNGLTRKKTRKGKLKDFHWKNRYRRRSLLMVRPVTKACPITSTPSAP